MVLLATAWGPRFGGINSFNQDLTIALSQEIGSAGRVICAATNATQDEIAQAKQQGVVLISVGKSQQGPEFDPSWIHELRPDLDQSLQAESVDCWLGHDAITGAAALRAPEIFAEGFTALIHHMSYEEYKSIERGNSRGVEAKIRRQQDIFGAEKAFLFAVGPTLVDSCKRLTEGKVNPTLLIPGFPESMDSNYSPDDQIVAVVSGRLDVASDRLKQGKLAIAAFSLAKKLASEGRRRLPALDRPRLYVIGVDADSSEETALLEFADSRAGEAVNVLTLPFSEDRKTYFSYLRRANLAFMPSWHEGFGMVGWEAIAAGTPLIISRHSGVYRLIKDELHRAGTSGVIDIDVQAQRASADGLNFTSNTLESVSDRILDVAENIKGYKTDALDLKQALKSKLGCTWNDTARQLLDGLRAGPINVDIPSGVSRASSTSKEVNYARLGIEGVYKSFLHYSNEEILREPGRVIVIMNDARSWLRNRRQALAERVRIRKQPTTLILIHPRSDFLPTLLRRNTTKTKKDQVGELRQALTIVEELKRGGEYPIELKGHFLYNPSVIFASNRLAVVNPYFVGIEGDMPSFVFRSGRESLHSLYWEEALAIDARSEIITPDDFKED